MDTVLSLVRLIYYTHVQSFFRSLISELLASSGGLAYYMPARTRTMGAFNKIVCNQIVLFTNIKKYKNHYMTIVVMCVNAEHCTVRYNYP